jgi:branched-chain amino acid transport system ATP-binding protein
LNRALRVTDVDVRYGRLQVLHGITIEVGTGELVTLIGNNGAGKTTLLHTISGILHPTAGEIEYEGARIDRMRPHTIVTRGISQVPQGKELFPAMTVLENLELGAIRAPAGTKLDAKLREVYEYFPILEARRKQAAGTLSGGEQQMLAIARALMAAPRLLLLDEPSAGLAPIVVDTLAEIILKLNADGLTILLVEQNAYLALELAQRAYILESGRVTDTGPADQLLHSDLVRRAYLGV